MDVAYTLDAVNTGVGFPYLEMGALVHIIRFHDRIV
jgi:hypothetical protein